MINDPDTFMLFKLSDPDEYEYATTPIEVYSSETSSYTRSQCEFLGFKKNDVEDLGAHEFMGESYISFHIFHLPDSTVAIGRYTGNESQWDIPTYPWVLYLCLSGDAEGAAFKRYKTKQDILDDIAKYETVTSDWIEEFIIFYV